MSEDEKQLHKRRRKDFEVEWRREGRIGIDRRNTYADVASWPSGGVVVVLGERQVCRPQTEREREIEIEEIVNLRAEERKGIEQKRVGDRARRFSSGTHISSLNLRLMFGHRSMESAYYG